MTTHYNKRHREFKFKLVEEKKCNEEKKNTQKKSEKGNRKQKVAEIV